nr:phytochrome B [Tanacetum cinerariifolium]
MVTLIVLHLTFVINHHVHNPQPKDEELSFEELFDDSFKIGAKNLRRMQQEEDQEGIFTPLNDAYDVYATYLILDELVEEFGDELLDTTIIDEEAYCNPTRDIKEQEKTSC